MRIFTDNYILLQVFSSYQIYLHRAIPEKNEGVRIYNFQGHLRNSKCNFKGLFKNNVVLPGVLVLGLKISEECNNFVEFLGVRFVLNPHLPPFVCFLNSLYYATSSLLCKFLPC